MEGASIKKNVFMRHIVQKNFQNMKREYTEEDMALFMTQKKREQIGDAIDDLRMRQYYHRCALTEAKKAGNKEAVIQEMKKIQEKEAQIQKLRKKLG